MSDILNLGKKDKQLRMLTNYERDFAIYLSPPSVIYRRYPLLIHVSAKG